MILRDARVDGGVVDIVIEGARIAEVGPAAGERRPGHELVDLEGRHVVPGLWDHHVHMGQWAERLRRLDVSGTASAAEVGALVRGRLAARPGEPVFGYGFRDGLWPDAPTAALLEAEVPVVLVSGDVHTTWANRAAVRAYGLAEDGWWLREQDAFDLNIRISARDAASGDADVLAAAAAAARRGVVGIVDFEMDDAPGAWRRRFASGFRGLRVRANVYPDRLDDARPTGTVLDEVGLLTSGRFKLFTDGSLNTRTAWTRDAYPDGGHGVAVHPGEELRELAAAAVARGLEPAIHAIGDAAVTLALDTFAALGVRGSLEHAQLVAVADLPRFAALGIVASIQPEHAMDDRDVVERYWAGSAERAFAYRALRDAGARLALGSDAPVAPLDPWVAMDAAVGRARDGRAPWHPEQALTRAEALDAATASTLASGQPADLAVLDADPATASLRTMPVHATLVAGEWSFSAR